MFNQSGAATHTDRETVIALTADFIRRNPGVSPRDAALVTLKEFYSLTDKGGIYGTSAAAVSMGWKDYGKDANILHEIVNDVAKEAIAMAQATSFKPCAERDPKDWARAAIKAHAEASGLEGDGRIRWWQTLASLYEYAKAEGIDFDEAMAEIRDCID